MNEFKLALKTKDFDYYVNVDESDENNSVIMKNKNNEVISSNYFAYSSFIDDLKLAIEDENFYEFVDEEILENGIKYFETYN